MHVKKRKSYNFENVPARMRALRVLSVWCLLAQKGTLLVAKASLGVPRTALLAAVARSSSWYRKALEKAVRLSRDEVHE